MGLEEVEKMGELFAAKGVIERVKTPFRKPMGCHCFFDRSVSDTGMSEIMSPI